MNEHPDPVSGTRSGQPDAGLPVVPSSIAFADLESPDAGKDDAQELGLLALGAILLKHWKLICGLPVAVASITVIVALILPVRYTASASFVPEVPNQGLQLPRAFASFAGLASQFGVNLPGGSTSPQFYADVVNSRSIKDEVLQTTLLDPRTADPADSTRLLEILDVGEETSAEALEAGRRVLEEMVTAEVNPETDVIQIAAETPYPQLSADLVNAYLATLNRFDLETRRSSAQEQRLFIENRLVDVQQELRNAENNLQIFLETNRRFETSPNLQFQYERLQRRVALKQEVYTTLLREHEQARIQEVNDTPVLTIIDPAIVPTRKSRPQRRLLVLTAFFLGGLVATIGAFVREFWERARGRGDTEYHEFESRWANAKSDLRAILHLRRSTEP
jgi:uncharacterized protein involved in exopolysaccharide biosynthesis